MNSDQKTGTVIDTKEDFNWASTIAVVVLMLAFIGASFYVLISSYMDIS